MSKYYVLDASIYFFLLIILIPKNQAVDIEYYNDNQYDNDLHNITIVIDEIDSRRTIKSKDFSKYDNNKNLANGSNLSNISKSSRRSSSNDEDIILSYQVKVPKLPLRSSYTNTENANESIEYTKSLFNDTVESTQTTTKTTIDLKIFEEYDYKYDDNQEACNILRYKSSLNNSLSASSNSAKYDMSLDKMMNSRFFSLDPAVDLENHAEKEANQADRNIWYVPQEFPCWELPILYGELGTKIKKSDIFLVYGGNLINVIDPWTKRNSSYTKAEPPMSHTMNKWCEVEPCYGDHTLCLFSNNHVSNICDRKYATHIPSIRDQFTIVNTINAMRNRVASGLSDTYAHLPTAANMKQVTYDYDLEKISETWLRQCLPGSAPCSALDGNIVTQLECTKYMKYCCLKKLRISSRCIPKSECFIHPVVGCLHVWFSSAEKNLIETDIHCGRTTVSTFNTVQLFWAKTNKIGCAYGERGNGDIRVVCNFSPGAPFHVETKLFCGLLAHNDVRHLRNDINITSLDFLNSLGIKWDKVLKLNQKNHTLNVPLDLQQMFATTVRSKSVWGVDSLTKVYKEGWVRKQLDDRENGTRGMIARLVARYIFIDESEARCDSDESVYMAGIPGSLCVEKSRTFHSLCYDFRDPTPGYRLIAILAPIALFSLILYDLFSGVVRQTIY